LERERTREETNGGTRAALLGSGEI
jgi:hypothetical protein